ncbi:Wd Repeat- And Fyve Domain-Containing Protein 4 [Manis pentadactyla]|nr:Wd Repeat- And Fyve Domain-Containing Protein 4 [Manis pentadactyla]
MSSCPGNSGLLLCVVSAITGYRMDLGRGGDCWASQGTRCGHVQSSASWPLVYNTGFGVGKRSGASLVHILSCNRQSFNYGVGIQGLLKKVDPVTLCFPETVLMVVIESISRLFCYLRTEELESLCLF